MKTLDKKALDGLDGRLKEIEKEDAEYWDRISKFNLDLGRRAYEHDYPRDLTKDTESLFSVQTGIGEVETWSNLRSRLIESAKTDTRVSEVGFDPEEYTDLVIRYCKLIYLTNKLGLEPIRLQPDVDYNLENDERTTIRFSYDELVKLTKLTKMKTENGYPSSAT